MIGGEESGGGGYLPPEKSLQAHLGDLADAAAARKPEQPQAAPVPSGPLVDLPAFDASPPSGEGQESTESLFEKALRLVDDGRINEGFGLLGDKVTDDQRDALKKAALHRLVPGEAQRNKLQTIKDSIVKKKTLTPMEENAIIDELTAEGMRREDIREFLETTQLEATSKQNLLERLKPRSEADERDAEALAVQEQKGAETLTQQAEQAKVQQVEALNAQLTTATGNKDKEAQKEIKKKLRRVNFMTRVVNPWLKKLEHWVDAPPKEWGIRVGKFLYIIAAMIILSFIIEMNMISKTAKKR